MKRVWFKRKTYGWGWEPNSWQGGVTWLVYSILVILFMTNIRTSTTTLEVMLTFVLPVIITTALFIALCYLTGEKPKWQWGEKK